MTAVLPTGNFHGDVVAAAPWNRWIASKLKKAKNIDVFCIILELTILELD